MLYILLQREIFNSSWIEYKKSLFKFNYLLF